MKTRQINLRVSDEWLQMVKGAAGDEKVSEYIRRAVQFAIDGQMLSGEGRPSGVVEKKVDKVEEVKREWRPRPDLSKAAQLGKKK